MHSQEADIQSQQSARTDRFGALGKRLTDLALVILALPIVFPIIAVLYLIVRFDGGPGFFGHRRIGKDGRSFRCWKIRTMQVDAEQALEAHLRDNPEARAMWERDFKLDPDPRITSVGRFLRETSLDELPQIFNVLLGEMSFVGPRPVTTAELPMYRGYEWCYVSVKPGITGLWQVSGRNDVDYSSRVQLDMAYMTSRSLLGDLHIILRTGRAVFSRTGK